MKKVGFDYAMEYRITFSDKEEESKAAKLLENEGLDFDWDSGDRMMLTKESLDFLYSTDVDFDEVDMDMRDIETFEVSKPFKNNNLER